MASIKNLWWLALCILSVACGNGHKIPKDLWMDARFSPIERPGATAGMNAWNDLASAKLDETAYNFQGWRNEAGGFNEAVDLNDGRAVVYRVAPDDVSFYYNGGNSDIVRPGTFNSDRDTLDCDGHDLVYRFEAADGKSQGVVIGKVMTESGDAFIFAEVLAAVVPPEKYSAAIEFVVKHELGHVLGMMTHVSDSNSVMSVFLNDATAFTSSDIAAFCKVYDC